MATRRVRIAGPGAHAAARAERLRAVAADVERGADSTTGLCTPIEAAWLSEHITPTDVHLFALRWFNPFGPTHLEFLLKTVPDSDVALLVANQRHPFSPEAWVLGLLTPSQRDGAGKLLAVFRELARREHGNANAFVTSSPTLALLPKGGPLGWQELKQIVRALLEVVDAYDLRQAVDYMRRFPARPWERTAAERDDVFARFAPYLKTKALPPELPRHGAIPDALFDRWWDCIVDPAHASAEMSEFLRAWDGSIRFRQGEFQRTVAAQDVDES